jgi:hypothetical protein
VSIAGGDGDSSPVLLAFGGSPPARAAVSEAALLFGGRRAIVLNVWQLGQSVLVR